MDFPIGNIMSLTRINIYSHNLVNELEDYSTRRSIETLDRGNNSITSTNYTAFIATGTWLIKVVRNVDKYFSRMVSILYMSCLIGFMSSLYLLSSIFSHNQRRHINSNTLHLTLTSTLRVHRPFVVLGSERYLFENKKIFFPDFIHISNMKYLNSNLKLFKIQN